jgi:hypothetical protein
MGGSMIKNGKSLQRNEDAFSQTFTIRQLIAPLGSLWLIDIAADYGFFDTRPHVEDLRRILGVSPIEYQRNL